MEGARDGRCEVTQAQGEWQDAVGYEERQDAEGLREPLWYVVYQGSWSGHILTAL